MSTEIIKNNGFYKLSELDTDKITLEDNLVVFIFDDLNKNIDVELGENSRLEFYGILENVGNFKINFIQNKINSFLIVRYLLLSKDNINVKAKIYSELSADHVKSDVKIISIVGSDGKIDLDGIIKINEGFKKVDANLIEDNLFLGNTGIINGIPTLLVRSDDVKASHSCKMERISDEKLFYLRSRGIGKENALYMIIESYITSMFKCLSMIDRNFYNNLIINILSKVK